MSFGNNLKTTRTKLGITQEELAGAIGVTPRSVIKYENGASYPSAELLPKISKILNVSIDDLMSDTDMFIARVYEKDGAKASKEASELVSGLAAMFAGGSISEEDKDAAMMALQRAYWKAKDENAKYTRKKYRAAKAKTAKG